MSRMATYINVDDGDLTAIAKYHRMMRPLEPHKHLAFSSNNFYR